MNDPNVSNDPNDSNEIWPSGERRRAASGEAAPTRRGSSMWRRARVTRCITGFKTKLGRTLRSRTRRAEGQSAKADAFARRYAKRLASPGASIGHDVDLSTLEW